MDVNPYLVGLLGLAREDFLSKKIWELGYTREEFLALRVFDIDPSVEVSLNPAF